MILPNEFINSFYPLLVKAKQEKIIYKIQDLLGSMEDNLKKRFDAKTEQIQEILKQLNQTQIHLNDLVSLADKSITDLIQASASVISGTAGGEAKVDFNFSG